MGARRGDGEAVLCASRSPGRPRCEETRDKVLTAAARLLERWGPRALTMERIASEAGVSKATLYRWWSCAAAIALEGFLATVEPSIAWPQPSESSMRQALTTQATSLVRLYRDTPHGRTIRTVIAEAQGDPEVGRAFLEGFLLPRRRLGREIIEVWKARGELRADVDAEVLLDLIYGPIYFRLLVGHQELTDAFVKRTVDLALAGLEVVVGARRRVSTRARRTPPRRKRVPSP
jgi:AcrR family transcriptional regulator